MGVAPRDSAARKSSVIPPRPIGECSASTANQSKPTEAMTSAAKGDARLSQVPIEICPSPNRSRILFFMIPNYG